MNSQELITTIISIVLSIVSAVLCYFSNKNAKVKKYYETFIKVEEKIKELCILAENNYKNGEQKKKYVIAHIGAFLTQENLAIEEEVINQIIESVISVSKNINSNGQSSK